MNTYFRILISVLAIAITSQLTIAARSRITLAALDSLDKALVHSNEILELRRNNVAKLKDTLLIAPQSDRLRLLSKIAQSYSGLNNDSSIVYLHNAWSEASSQGNSQAAQDIALSMATHLARATMFDEALAILQKIDPDDQSDESKRNYYRALARVHIYCEQYHRLPFKKNESRIGAISAIDSLMTLIPANSDETLLIKSLKYILENQNDFARGELLELLERKGPGASNVADIYILLARVEKNNPDKYDEYIYYMSKAAAANILDGNCETPTLPELGIAMFKDGETERAYNYLTSSSERIYKSSAVAQYITLIPAMSSLVASMNHHERRHNFTTSIIIITLLVIIALGLYINFRSRKKIKMLQTHRNSLESTISARDSYIEHLLSLCSIYIEGIEDVNRLVMRKLKARQFQELLDLCESEKMIREHSEKFFEIFDKAILEIYPNFIVRINCLLLPDRQYEHLPNSPLGPELRIIAFMRMGVTDSSRVARFLGLSLNTVYTYKNRIRNRLTDKENFESNLEKTLSNA